MESSSTKFRFVRCPRCLKLLVEYAEISVYQCGGCRAVLRAKNSTAAGGNVNLGTLKTEHSLSLSDNGSSDNGSTSSVKQMIAYSTSAHSSELEHLHQEDGETAGKNGVQDNVSDTNQLDVRGDASQSQPDEGIHAKIEEEKSLKPSQQHSGSSKAMNKVEEPQESISHSVASEEDLVERGSDDGLELSLWSPAARGSRAYDGSVSSGDDGYNNHALDRSLLLSRRTSKQPIVMDMADIEGKEGEKKASRSNQRTVDVEADLQARTFLPKLSNEGHGSDIMRSFNARRNEFSFDSEDFSSVQNWMEPENGPSRYDRMDLLRKIDELKNQLHGLCDQRVEGERPYFRGMDGQQPFYHESVHQPPQYFDSPEALYGPRQITSQRYRFPQMPFSGQPRCFCLNCQQLPLQPNHCADGMCKAHAYSLCSHFSTAGSSGNLDHEQEKLHYNEKRKLKKKHCRPISGGAPFIICCNCFELLQLPTDFLILRRRLHKLHCAACSKILTLSFPARACINPQTPTEDVHPHTEVGNSADVFTGSVSHSNDHPQGDPVSFSDEYGLSFTKSFSTEAEPVLLVSRKSPEEKNVKQTSGSALHRLLGYSSASELLYKRWDIDEGYESIESAAPHSYRPSQEGRPTDGLRARKISISCLEQIGPCSNPDCMEIHEEEATSEIAN